MGLQIRQNVLENLFVPDEDLGDQIFVHLVLHNRGREVGDSTDECVLGQTDHVSQSGSPTSDLRVVVVDRQ